jgi:hypothetical protein
VPGSRAAWKIVGLIALLDPQALALYPETLHGSLKLQPPAKAAEPLVSELRARKVDWIVVLFHGPLAEAERLARKVRGIDLVVIGHEQRLVEPRRVNGALIVSPGEEENRLGLLSLRKDAFGRVRSAHEFRLFRFDRDPRPVGSQLGERRSRSMSRKANAARSLRSRPASSSASVAASRGPLRGSS